MGEWCIWACSFRRFICHSCTGVRKDSTEAGQCRDKVVETCSLMVTMIIEMWRIPEAHWERDLQALVIDGTGVQESQNTPWPKCGDGLWDPRLSRSKLPFGLPSHVPCVVLFFFCFSPAPMPLLSSVTDFVVHLCSYLFFLFLFLSLLWFSYLYFIFLPSVFWDEGVKEVFLCLH